MTSELIQQLPVGFGAWPVTGQAAALFFSTFVLEDVAAVGAGLLLSAGALGLAHRILGVLPRNLDW